MSRANVIERAFQLASDCQSVVEVRERLRREGYIQVDAHFSGRMVKKQIRQRLKGGSPQAA
jgi:hypothetical protein